MNIAEVLANTLSPEQQLRENATAQLESAAAQNFPVYVELLSSELANERSQSHVRQAAGLALKNALVSKDTAEQQGKAQRWLALPAEARQKIKQLVLDTLRLSEIGAGQTTAQVVSAIAVIELPCRQWPELIHVLLENVATGSSANIKQCSLQAIGFTCEAIDPESLAPGQSNQILSAVIQGARKEEPSNEVRLIAIKALINCLDFIHDNFCNLDERNHIMQVVCEATQCTEVAVQASAFECLGTIMRVYYEHMSLYMEQALYALTVYGMKSEHEEVALQAVEFWSSTCDREIDIASEIEMAADEERKPEAELFNFARKALDQILPVLLWLLTKQDEDQDDDEWRISMAAGTCLALLAQCVGDAIVPPTIPFIQGNIQSSDRAHREAAVMAFGSILEGPDPQNLHQLVQQALPLLLNLVQDPVVQVKDTAAWTLGRISQILGDAVDPNTQMPNLIATLVNGLADAPKVATHCCWALMNLVNSLAGDEPHPLTNYFQPVLTAVVNVSEKPMSDTTARTSLYEVMSAIVSNASQGMHHVVLSLCDLMVQRLNQTIVMQNQLISVEERLSHEELQSNLCSVLAAIVRHLGKDIQPYADQIMTVLLQILSTASKGSTVPEDVFLTIGVLATSLEQNFARYVDSFAQFLYAALQNHEEYQLCQIAVGLVGDICRGLGPQSRPFCGPFMSALLEDLRSETLHRDVKPAILSAFGDVALAIEGEYEEFLDVSMTVLQQAGNITVPEDDCDMTEYVGELQHGILEAYTGIVQGIKASGKAQLLRRYAPAIFVFLHRVYVGRKTREHVVRSIVGLLGDLCDALPYDVAKESFSQPWVRECIHFGRTGTGFSPSTKETARWAREVVRKMVSV